MVLYCNLLSLAGIGFKKNEAISFAIAFSTGSFERSELCVILAVILWVLIAEHVCWRMLKCIIDS